LYNIQFGMSSRDQNDIIARAAKSTLTAGSKDTAARPQMLLITTDMEGFISAEARSRCPKGAIR